MNFITINTNLKNEDMSTLEFIKLSFINDEINTFFNRCNNIHFSLSQIDNIDDEKEKYRVIQYIFIKIYNLEVDLIRYKLEQDDLINIIDFKNIIIQLENFIKMMICNISKITNIKKQVLNNYYIEKINLYKVLQKNISSEN